MTALTPARETPLLAENRAVLKSNMGSKIATISFLSRMPMPSDRRFPGAGEQAHARLLPDGAPRARRAAGYRPKSAAVTIL